MRLRWAIQDALGSVRDRDHLIGAVQTLGLESALFTLRPFSEDLPDLPAEVPTIFYGSTSAMTRIGRSGRWSPGVFFPEERFDFRSWGPAYGDACLNAGAQLSTLRSLEPEGPVFLRPVQDLKEFAGRLMATDEVQDWRTRLVEAGLDELLDTPILAAPPQELLHEWRLFLADGVVVAGSRYRSLGRADLRAEIPELVRDFAEEQTRVYAPHAVFVMDVAAVGDTLRIIEVNGFNSAGFYESDVQAIVAAISEWSDPSSRS